MPLLHHVDSSSARRRRKTHSVHLYLGLLDYTSGDDITRGESSRDTSKGSDKESSGTCIEPNCLCRPGKYLRNTEQLKFMLSMLSILNFSDQRILADSA